MADIIINNLCPLIPVNYTLCSITQKPSQAFNLKGLYITTVTNYHISTLIQVAI